jgi:hypothetical protein
LRCAATCWLVQNCGAQGIARVGRSASSDSEQGWQRALVLSAAGACSWSRSRGKKKAATYARGRPVGGPRSAFQLTTKWPASLLPSGRACSAWSLAQNAGVGSAGLVLTLCNGAAHVHAHQVYWPPQRGEAAAPGNTINCSHTLLSLGLLSLSHRVGLRKKCARGGRCRCLFTLAGGAVDQIVRSSGPGWGEVARVVYRKALPAGRHTGSVRKRWLRMRAGNQRTG